MTKAIVRFGGYTDYVLDLKDAVAVAEILSRAEVYESKYRTGQESTHHVYSNHEKELGQLRLISHEFYNMCKLAGKPTDS